VPNNPRGDYLPTEEVAYIAVGTNSTSPVNQVNFVMAKVGVCLANGNNEFILNPSELAVTPTLSQVLTSGSAAGSQPISGVTTLTATALSAPTLDASAALNVGATTALGVNVGRSGQTTDLVGNVRVNGSSGTSGYVLTSTGVSTAPTWQAVSGGSVLPTIQQGPTFISSGFVGGAARFVYDNATFQNVVVTSVTAKYLVTGQALVNSSGVTTNLWANLGIRTGGGTQTDAALVRSAFNNTLMSVAPNTTFSQTNSLAQCSVSPANLFHKLQFSIVVTPGAINTFSFAIWIGTSGGGSGTVYTLIIEQIAA
jgi:hypothetical protein